MIDQKTAPYAALLLRVSLGVMFIAHSLYLKVVVFTIPGTVQFFESLGLPGFTAYATIAAESLGGIALILGIQTRSWPGPCGCMPATAGCSPPRAGVGNIPCF